MSLQELLNRIHPLNWLSFVAFLFICQILVNLLSRKPADSLRIIQYNAEWLFLDEYNGCPGSKCKWKTQQDAENHFKNVASVLSSLDGDIINLCEVRGLTELQRISGSLEGVTPYFVQGMDRATGQNVGLLTRYETESQIDFLSGTATYPPTNGWCERYKSRCVCQSRGSNGVSKGYLAKFNIGSLKLAIISAHLLAFPYDASRCAKREAQAFILRDYANEMLAAGYEVILLGDFNDFDRNYLDAARNYPISMALDILKCSDCEKELVLNNIAALIPEKKRYTSWFDQNGNGKDDGRKEHSMIDHILISPGLYQHVYNAGVFLGYQQSSDNQYSDHFPIYIDIDISSFK